MKSIKAIPTKYRGTTYRSRMEARWAVFMDTARIPFIYEMEGYDLDGAWYLPDFYLPDNRVFIEIKSPMASVESFEKPRLLTYLSNLPVFIFQDPPFIEFDAVPGRYPHVPYAYEVSRFGIEGIKPFNEELDGFRWTECPECEMVSLAYLGLLHFGPCRCLDSYQGNDGLSDKLMAAYQKSQSYQFKAA